MKLRALDIAEIVGNVLKYSDPKTLLAAAQVNSIWAEEATNWLWRGDYRSSNSSFAHPLQKIKSLPAERRLWYTSKIRHMQINFEDDFRPHPGHQELIAGGFFSFPGLRSVIVDIGSENMKEEHMLQFLSPSLVSLELFGGYYTAWFLDQIKTHSPFLKFFLIDNSQEEEVTEQPLINTKNFMKFLNDMPSIVNLELHSGWSRVMGKSFLQHLMLCPTLEILNLGWELALEEEMMVRALYNCDSRPIFPALRHLSVIAEEKAFRPLIPFLGKLQGLSISLINQDSSDSQESIFELLHACPLLEDIEFSASRPTIISSAAFLKVASGCPMLRRLQIGDNCECDSQFNDGLIETLTRRWKELAVFDATFRAKLSHRSLVAFGINCPRLHELSIEQDLPLVDMGNLYSGKPFLPPGRRLFPSLEILTVDSVSFHSINVESLASYTNDLLDELFPALQTFDFSAVTHFDGNGTSIARNIKDSIRSHLSRTRPRMPFPPAYPATSVAFERLLKLFEPDLASRYNSAF